MPAIRPPRVATGAMDEGDEHGGGHRPPPLPRSFWADGSPVVKAVLLVLIAAFVYLAYFWMIRRVHVPSGHVLVLVKKDGAKSLEGDQVIIPGPPDQTQDPGGYAAWVKKYGDYNGILEHVYPEGTYFGYSPFDYDREVIDISQTAIVPSGKVGVVIKKFGQKLPPDQVMAEPTKDQRGPLPHLLQPGRYNQYANPYAYEIKMVDPVQVNPGERGVVTLMSSRPAKNPNLYLVEEGEQGTQKGSEPEGFRYINPFEKRIMPVSIRSQRFELTGDEVITFPSSDSFEIRLEGFVEWSIMPDKLPLIYVEYGEGGDLIPLLEKNIILPYARSFCRVVGSQYTARDFISGDTKLKFQQEFESKLRQACEAQGVEVLQALVRDIVPPEAIKQPINDREVAKQQILQYDQQIKTAATDADRTTQEEMSKQNAALGEANKQVVTVTKAAEQAKDVAVTKAQQELAVSKLRLDAAKQQAEAQVAKGQADAQVILLKVQAEAEPLRQQVQAFGDGESFARYFFYQKVAPSLKTILTNTDGPFADIFKQFAAPPSAPPKKTEAAKVTDAGAH